MKNKIVSVKKLALIIALLILYISCGQQHRQQPVAIEGLLDLTGWDFEKDGPVKLKGEWEFYWKKLVTPEELQSKNPPKPTGYIKVPGSWNSFKIAGKKIGEDGFATYRLTVITKSNNEIMALKIGEISVAYSLYVNDELISSVGKLGTSTKEEYGLFKINIVGFTQSHDKIDIIFHVSNHSSTGGGIRRTIVLGREHDCLKNRENNLTLELFFVGILFIMTFYHFSIYILRKKEMIPLYFCLLCFLLIFRIICAGELFIINLLSDFGFNKLLTWRYTANHLIFIFMIMYFYEILKEEISRKVFIVLQLLLLMMLIATIASPLKTKIIIANYISTTIAIAAIIYIILILKKPAIEGKDYSILYLSGLILVIIFSILDSLYTNEIIQVPLYFTHGAILYLFINAFIIAKQYSDAYDENLALKKGLEIKVEERTKELAHALDEVETINERLTESNTKLEGLGNSLRKYLPHQLVSCIMDGKVATCNETERKKITIFFSDIKAFTDTTDSLEAEELSNLLNEYLTEMTKIAAKHGGTIDKFIGDAVMIFFGAPESSGEKEDALRCVRMAVEMQARMKELNEKWFNQGFERPLEIRIGVNTGVATVGDFGAEERLSYTTIGGQVNIASRLESMCEPGSILISHATWALVKDEFNCNPRGAAQVKGIHHDVLVYEVVAS